MMMIKTLEQKPSDDCISRQAVLDKINEVCFSKEKEWIDFRASWSSNGQRNLIIEFIEILPSVTPQPKIGHWITQWNITHQKEYYCCSECRKEFSYDGETGIEMSSYDFCPNCGKAKIKKEIKDL